MRLDDRSPMCLASFWIRALMGGGVLWEVEQRGAASETGEVLDA